MPVPKAAPGLPVVFISSTAEDLGAYRTAAEKGVRTARCFPDVHELWVARDKPPLDECLRRVREADALVVIVAYRYGWVPPDQPEGKRKSITWLECEEAAKGGKEVLAFLVNETVEWPEEAKEEYRLVEAARTGKVLEIAAEVQQNVDCLRDLKAWLRGRGIRDEFVNPEDLQGKVATALYEWRQRHPEFETGAEPPPPPARDPGPYLKALRDETGFVEIRGLRARKGEANRFPIDDLYVPLVNELGGGRDLPTAHESKLDLDEALDQPRLVIVGDPGAGKSTFVRRVVHALCDPNLDPKTFPILIRVADLADFLKKERQAADPADSPMWIVRLLETQHGAIWGLDRSFFLRNLQDGPCLLALDGLDEAPGSGVRERISRIVEKAARAWPNCRILVTTRPKAYTEDVVLAGFAEARIADLDEEAVRIFLHRWSGALFPESPERADSHANELIGAVESRADIRRIARNPVMLTALAVLYWNDKRLPQQRAELYESILGWLSRSRKERPNRPSPERCIALLQELARAMQEHSGGRQVQVPREWAAEMLAPRFREIAPEEQRERAALFLEEEELDSGIVVRRGSDIRFWHLTFQEHMAARALAGEDDAGRHKVLFAEQRAWNPDWREVVLLLAGLLHEQKVERVDALVSAALDTLSANTLANRLRSWWNGGPSLATQASCASLLGAMLLDLEPLKYKPKDPRYEETLRAVMGIFDPELSAGVPLRTRIEAAEALGQAGDPRLRQNNWVRIPAGMFVMGEGTDAHQVELSAYEIAKYPVTVAEFGKYVKGGGREPDQWENQILYPNRPVVYVSWHDAAGYCAWAGVRLPTEAEWERAARGAEGRLYPWGNQKPDATRANYSEAKIGATTPVGIFPRGATPDGIQDLAGNVWEWVADWYAEYPKEKQWDPKGPATGEVRVMRGGSWIDPSVFLRASYRLSFVPVGRYYVIGFRCARDIGIP
jgi:formylglycine-generating enzyme required for sulfatase activity